MASADLLLYRPWRDASRREQQEPVDFSKKTENCTATETDPSCTDINSTSKSGPHNNGKLHYDNVGNDQADTKSTKSERDTESGTPDSGFNSPSDGAYASPYYLFPGLYQQALANHALQREAFYRDAIQREIFSRQHCPQDELQNKLFFHDIPKLQEQNLPLALVVKRNSSSVGKINIDSRNDHPTGDCINIFNDDRVPTEGSYFSDGESVDDIRKRHDSDNIYDGDSEGVDEKYSSHTSLLEDRPGQLVPPPQTSPYHLLPPALYWPHGSTPMANHLAKPLTNHFNSVSSTSIERPQPKPLLSPVSLIPPNEIFPSVSNPMSSPLGRHFSNSFHNQLTSPLTSPVARAAFDLSRRITGVTNSNGDYSAHHQNSQSSPKLNTPSKSPSKSLSGSSVSLKRKLPASSLSPDKKGKSPKKAKASRKLNFDEDKSSPVSGTIIRELVDGEEPLVVRKGDIDPEYNVVEVTEEAKAEIAKIENKIGEYVCRLCKELYDDAFGLAQHRCSRIIHVEYRCPECDKVFNCPANLASHRRWHKPKGSTSKSSNNILKTSSDENCMTKDKICSSEPSTSSSVSCDEIFISEEDNLDEKETEIHDCPICFKTFKRQAYLRKHLLTHRRDADESDTIVHPIPQKYSLHHQIPQAMHPHFNSSATQLPHSGSILSPLTSPMLSPPFSPSEILKCHICHSTFFTSTALTIHFATVHSRDHRHDPGFPQNQGFVEFALGNLSSSSGLGANTIGPGLHHPRPHYVQEKTHLPMHLLHRPAQISASS